MQVMRPALVITCILASAFAATADARGTYLEPRAFVAEVFGGEPPPPRMLWLTGDVRAAVREVTGHDPEALRLRYWARGGRSAWVLDEIGKEQPITIGVVVGDAQIERIEVLVFRESRGWEVRYPFFTGQFTGARLTPAGRLDRDIDGISGATLSVNAMRKVARLALVLDAHARRASSDHRLTRAD